VLKVGKLHKLRQEEDTLLSSNEQSITEALKAKALPVLDQLDSTAKELGKVMKSLSKTTAHVNSAVEDFEATSKSLRGIMEDNRASIKGTSQNIHKITGALASAQKDVNEVIGKMNRFGDTLTSLELGKTVDNANKSIESLNTMLTRINKGQGTLGKLAVNDSLYNNLKSTSANLDQLFIDMKANPKRYVHFSIFGKKDKKEQKK
jgi:phospholipid/cholesterol/gamma-HCH transport system substrate-binding protein